MSLNSRGDAIAVIESKSWGHSPPASCRPMENSPPFSNTDNKAGICPFFGLKDDPQTTLSYPSIWNVCHHTRPKGSPNFYHQRLVCMTPSHSGCPIFSAEKIGRMPSEIMAAEARTARLKQILLWALPIVLFLILGVMGGRWLITHTGGGQETATSLVTQAAPVASPTTIPSPSKTATPTTVENVPVTQTPTLTKTPTPNTGATATAACAAFRNQFPGTPCP
jgi:hypothetical protein